MADLTTVIAATATWTTVAAAPGDKTLRVKKIAINNRSGLVGDIETQNEGTDSDSVAIADDSIRFPAVAAGATMYDLGDDWVEVWENFQVRTDVQPIDVTVWAEEFPEDPYPLTD